MGRGAELTDNHSPTHHHCWMCAQLRPLSLSCHRVSTEAKLFSGTVVTHRLSPRAPRMCHSGSEEAKGRLRRLRTHQPHQSIRLSSHSREEGAAHGSQMRLSESALVIYCARQCQGRHIWNRRRNAHRHTAKCVHSKEGCAVHVPFPVTSEARLPLG